MNEHFKSRPAVQALETHLKSLPYGTFVSYEDLNKIAGVDLQSPKFRYVLESAKRILLKHHDKVMINIRGKGYEVGTPPGIMAESAARRKRAFNTVKNGFRIVNTIDLSQLNEADRNKAIKEQAKNGLLLVCYKATENKLLNDPTENVPIAEPTETQIVKMLLDKTK